MEDTDDDISDVNEGTYELEHAIATLGDCTVDKYHEYGGSRAKHEGRF